MATYYIREDGTAANKAAATSDAAANTSLSISGHNGETFSPGDLLVISDNGGVYDSTTLVVPSSGTSGSKIVYEFDAGVVMDAQSARTRCFEASSKDHITLNGNGSEMENGTGSDGPIRFDNCDGMTIDNFVIHDGPIYSIRCNRCSDLIIRRVEAYNSGWNNFSIGQLWGPSEPISNILIEYCDIHDAFHNGIDIHASEATSQLSDVTLRYNYCHENGQSGMYFQDEADVDNPTEDIYVYGNISVKNGRTGIAASQVPSGQYFDNFNIIGNTFIGNGTEDPGSWGAAINLEARNVTIKNNICYEDQVAGRVDDWEIRVSSGGGSVTVDYTLVYNTYGGDLYEIDGTGYTHAEYLVYGQQANGKSENPDVTNIGGDDFTLSSVSPCIDTAVNLGSNYVDALDPSSSTASWVATASTLDQDDNGDEWEMGAYVYEDVGGVVGYPVYEDNGGIGADTGATVDVPYPGTVNANDILLVIVGDEDDDQFTTPANWNKIDHYTDHSQFSAAWFWKRATGSESGNETFTSASTDGTVIAGVMLRFSGCITTGSPFDNEMIAEFIENDSSQQIHNNVTSGYQAANEWTASETCTIDSVLTLMKRVGSPTGDVWVEIWDESGGTPNAVISNGTSAVVDVTTIPTSIGGAYAGEEIKFVFGTPPTLTNANNYYFFIRSDMTVNGSDFLTVGNHAFDGTFIKWRYEQDTDWVESGTHSMYMRVATGPSYPTMGAFASSAATAKPAIETDGVTRLCVALVGIEDNVGTSDDASNYGEIVDVTTDTGNDMGFSVFTYQQATAGTVAADSATIGGTEYNAALALALIPAVTVATIVIPDMTSASVLDSPIVIFAPVMGAGMIHLTIDQNGKPIVYEGVDARISGSNSDVTDDDDVAVILDGTDVSLFVNGTQIGSTYSSLSITTGTTFTMNSIGTAGSTDSVELWPRNVSGQLPGELT